MSFLIIAFWLILGFIAGCLFARRNMKRVNDAVNAANQKIAELEAEIDSRRR